MLWSAAGEESSATEIHIHRAGRQRWWRRALVAAGSFTIDGTRGKSRDRVSLSRCDCHLARDAIDSHNAAALLRQLNMSRARADGRRKECARWICARGGRALTTLIDRERWWKDAGLCQIATSRWKVSFFSPRFAFLFGYKVLMLRWQRKRIGWGC